MEAAACIHQSSALKTSSHVTLSRQVCLLDMQHARQRHCWGVQCGMLGHVAERHGAVKG